MMDDLVADFVSEAREMLVALEGEVVAWEKSPDDRDRLDAIFRFFHTVKGNCGFFDFPRLESLSHAAEDALSEVRKGERRASSALVDAILAIMDRIAELIEAIATGAEFTKESDDGLIAALSLSCGDDALDGSAMPSDREPGTASIVNARTDIQSHTVRLPVQLLDRIMSGVSDMILAGNDLGRQIDGIEASNGLESSYNRLYSILADLRLSIMQARMQPIDSLFSSYRRLVRDLGAELERPVDFEIESGQVEIDREMIELIRDPILHLLRNALDHGIETPAERRAQGKPEVGKIKLSARQTGNEIRIGISDDGRGIDGDRITEKAIACGILTAEQASRLDPDARVALICEPGLSTAEKVTALSGRGVGMDAVRASVERLGGTLNIHSTLQAGTRILLKVPLTLSIVPSVTIRSAGQIFAIPRSYIDEIVKPDKDCAFNLIGGMRHITLRGEERPCFGLAEALGVETQVPFEDQTLVMLKLISGLVFGLGVDDIDDHGELVIKPVAPQIIGTGLYVGVAQLDDGQAALMLDVVGIAKEGGIKTEIQRKQPDQAASQTPKQQAQLSAVMTFIGFDGARKAIATSMVERLVDVAASDISVCNGTFQLVHEGRLVPIFGIGGDMESRARVQVLLLHDGAQRIAYAMSASVDAANIDLSSAVWIDGQAVVLVDGEPVEVIEGHQLFCASGQLPEKEATCRMPLGDPWCRDFLRPMVEANGYRIVADGADAVDLEIRFDFAEDGSDLADKAKAPAGSVLTLAKERQRGPGTSDAVFRYDRDAIVAALAAARQRGAA